MFVFASGFFVIVIKTIFQSTLKMRIRLSYVINGGSIQEQTEVNNFPTDIWD